MNPILYIVCSRNTAIFFIQAEVAHPLFYVKEEGP